MKNLLQNLKEQALEKTLVLVLIIKVKPYSH